MSPSGFEHRKYLSLINKNKRIFAVFCLSIMTIFVAVSYLLPKKYEARSTVFIEKNVISELVKGITVSPSRDDSIKVLTYALNSRTLVMKVINELDFNLKARSDAEVERLLKELQANTEIRVKDKDLFTISFRHEDPKVARDYVNTLIRSYIEENVSANREETVNASKFLADQIVTFKDKMEKAEAAVAHYKSNQGGVVNLDEGRLLQEIGIAQQKIFDLQLRRKLLEGQKSYANTPADPLQLKLNALQKKFDELRVDYTDNFPEVKAVKAHIEALKDELKTKKIEKVSSLEPHELFKIETELNAIRENESNLQRYIDANQKLLTTIPSAKADLQKLEAEKMNQKNMYDLLFLRLDQSEVSKQMELQDKGTIFRIVDPAVAPVAPVSPNRKKIMLMGMAAGLAGGLGLLLLIDYLDNSVTVVGSLKTFGLPVLAVIPLIRSVDEVQVEKKQDRWLYAVSGAYFSLIAAILLMEFMGITIVDTFVNKLELPRIAAKVISRFR